jgi:hypothetical protein
MGIRFGVVVQKPYIIGAMGEGVANSEIIAPRKPEILPALEHEDVGKRCAYLCDRIVRRTIVHDNECHSLIAAFYERSEALNRMGPTVPVQDDATHLWYQIQCAHSHDKLDYELA